MKKLKENHKILRAGYAFLAVFVMVSAFLLTAQIIFADNVSDGANCTGTRSSAAPSSLATTGRRICLTSQILLTTDVTVTSSAGVSAGQQNAVKVGKDGSITVAVTVKLSAPIDLRVDKSDDNAIDEVYFPSWFNRSISGFGATLTPQDTSKYCGNTSAGYVQCQSDGKIGSGFGYGVSSKGKYDDFTEQPNLKTFNAGDTVYSGSFSIPASDFTRLGITNVYDSSTNNQGLNLFYAYPDLVYYYKIQDDNWTTFLDAGKGIYVQLYPTDAAAKADTSAAQSCNTAPAGSNSGTSTTTPTCITDYGSNTAGGNNVGSTPGVLSGILDLIAKVVAGLAFILQELIYAIFTFLLVPLLSGLLSIHTYTDTFAGVIYPGWLIVRNFCNILFVISIIAIAMGTLFRVESYQYKHLLVQLIIGALLVNFSLVIGQAVLGLADTAQNQFLPNQGDVARSLGRILIINRNNINQFAQFSQNSGAAFAQVITPLFSVALALGSFAVFAALVGLLAIRIVALWIYLMVSPIAYVAGVLPITAKYRDEWWSGFIKYAFFTPVIAFFLNIAATLATSQANNPILTNLSSAVTNDKSMTSSPNIASFVFSVGSNILLLIFIFAALQVADKLGVYGGSFVSEWGKKGMMAPFQAAGWGLKRGGGYVARIYNEQTSKLVTDKHGATANLKKAAFAVLNPVNFFKGWQERAHEKQEWAQEMAQGAGQMVASELLTGGKERINYKELALQKIQNGLASKLRESLGDDPGRAPSMDLQRRINEVTGLEGQLLRGAAAKLVGDQGWNDDTNEVASDTAHDRHYWMEQLKKRGTNDNGIKLFKQACVTYDDQGFETMQWVYQGLDLNMLARLRADKDNKIQTERDPHDSHKFADPEYQAFIEKNQLALMNVAALTNGAKKVGHYEQMFMAKKDDKSGMFIPLVDSDADKKEFEANPEKFEASSTKGIRTNEIIGEVNKIGIRGFWQNTAWHTLVRKVKKDKSGKSLTAADWDKDGEWSVGSLSEDKNSLMQEYLWKKTMAGKKYASQAGHAQARMVGYVVGKCFDSKGKIKAGMEKEYEEMYKVNPDLTKILTFMQLSGNPPLERDNLSAAEIEAQLGELLMRHGNAKPSYLP